MKKGRLRSSFYPSALILLPSASILSPEAARPLLYQPDGDSDLGGVDRSLSGPSGSALGSVVARRRTAGNVPEPCGGCESCERSTSHESALEPRHPVSHHLGHRLRH